MDWGKWGKEKQGKMKREEEGKERERGECQQEYREDIENDQLLVVIVGPFYNMFNSLLRVPEYVPC